MLALVLSASLAIAPPELCLDRSFGDGGAFVLDVGNRMNVPLLQQGIDQQRDGKWVIAGIGGTWFHGRYLVARLDVNGQLDTTFGDGGLVEIDLGGSFQTPGAVRVLRDGSILLAGVGGDPANRNADMSWLIRLASDGQLVRATEWSEYPVMSSVNGLIEVDGGVWVSASRIRSMG